MSITRNESLRRLIELAKREDLGDGDLTTSLMSDAQAPGTFRLIAKQTGVFAGREIAPAVLSAYEPAIEIEWSRVGCDGCLIDAVPTELATFRGPLSDVLAAERVLLNFLQHLSGIATLTRSFVDAVAGTAAKIYDTRKTTPGWRDLEKYAVRCGGGENHRLGLYDAILIKDNHLTGVATSRLAGVVFDMLNGLDLSKVNPAFVEVEARCTAQVEALCKVVGIDVILLDNFSLDELHKAVGIRDHAGLKGKMGLEASGGITLATVRKVAETGVERISVGAITHSAAALDLSLERT